MTELTEDGKRLADALVKAGVVRPTSPVPIHALNTAAASLRLTLEGDASPREACEPWSFSTGEPPDYDSPLSGVFGAGMAYTESLLAKLLDVSSYEGGDGSEDFDSDATMTLVNILAAAGLYDKDECQPIRAALASPQPEAKGPAAAGVKEALEISGIFGEGGQGKLTIRDLAYTAFMRAKGKNDEDGGPTDWFTDTLPLVLKGIEKLRGYVDASTTPPAEAKTPDAGVGEALHLSDLRGLFKDHYAADAPVGEDETGVREAALERWWNASGIERYNAKAAFRAAWSLAPQPPKAETPAGVEDARHPWCQPGDDPVRKWMVTFEDTEQGHALFTDETEAREHFRKANDGGWNCYLFQAAALSTAPAARPGDEVVAEIAAERRRQIEAEGWTPEHDDDHAKGEMALAAACYATPVQLFEHQTFANATTFGDPWPWDKRWDKRPADGNLILPNSTLDASSRRRQLVKSGALIVAEIERLDRTELAAAPAADGGRS